MYIHICTCVNMHQHISRNTTSTCMYTDKQTQLYIRMYVYISVNTRVLYIRTRIHKYVCTYVYTYIHVHMYVHLRTNMCIPVLDQKARQTVHCCYTATYVVCMHSALSLCICMHDVHMYVRTYIHVYKCTYIHIYVHTYAHIYIRMHIHTYANTYVCTYVCICICIHVYVRMHTQACTYLSLYLHLHVRIWNTLGANYWCG